MRYRYVDFFICNSRTSPDGILYQLIWKEDEFDVLTLSVRVVLTSTKVANSEVSRDWKRFLVLLSCANTKTCVTSRRVIIPSILRDVVLTSLIYGKDLFSRVHGPTFEKRFAVVLLSALINLPSMINFINAKESFQNGPFSMVVMVANVALLWSKD